MKSIMNVQIIDSLGIQGTQICQPAICFPNKASLTRLTRNQEQTIGRLHADQRMWLLGNDLNCRTRLSNQYSATQSKYFEKVK